jgi:hypothetical protein
MDLIEPICHMLIHFGFLWYTTYGSNRVHCLAYIFVRLLLSNYVHVVRLAAEAEGLENEARRAAAEEAWQRRLAELRAQLQAYARA